MSYGDWYVEVDNHDSLVRMEGDEDGPAFIADCGAGGEAYLNAQRIVSDHNGCLGIEDPATTVPELVDVCRYALLAVKSEEPMSDKWAARLSAVLAKTGKT